MRIAWFTPLQPVESGISLYSEELLSLLSHGLDIDVVVDGYRPTMLRQSPRIRVVDVARFDPDSYDLIIYQIGNSPAHVYMLPWMERAPGLMVLHDTMLNHLQIQAAVANGDLPGYRDEMERRYGAPGLAAAERVLKGQAPDDLFNFPMSEHLIETSLGTLVHSDFARRSATSWVPNAAVFRVPHGLRLPEDVSRDEARQILGLPADQFIVGSVSHINPHKRIDVVLRAFKELRRTIPARLILAGSISPNLPLGRMIGHLGLDQVVDTPGYVSDEQARIITAASDVIVNLRYPTAGETSGSLLRSMAAGRPVLVSRAGSFTEVPSDAAIEIPVDALEQTMLVRVLTRLAEDEHLREEIGRRARAFVADEHSLSRWANGYLAAISQLTGREIEPAVVDESVEPISRLLSARTERSSDDLTRSIARDIAELGLGGDERLVADVARSQVEMGLSAGKIISDEETGSR
jgi:glycosyltransferase involved in cell wall biosynthesis